MRVTQVEYRRLQSFGDYSNETIGCVVELDDSDEGDPEAALSAAKTWVSEQLAKREEAIDLRVDVHSLRSQKRDLEDQLANLKSRYERAIEFLDKAGIPIPKAWQPDDLPF